MTAAQKAAKEKFKKAIAYRKKTGCSLKEAFAHIYGKKVGAVKKNAKSYHKDTKSHNVNIRVMSGLKINRKKGKLGALPINFTGSILGLPFKVYNQYNLDDTVTLQIVENKVNGYLIAEIIGRSGEVETVANKIWGKIDGEKRRDLNAKDEKKVKKTIKDFVQGLHVELKKFNLGKDTRTKKGAKLTVKAVPKKSTSAKDKIKDVLRSEKKRLKYGYTIVPGKVMNGIDKNDNKILNEIKFLKTDIIQYENAIKRIKKELPSLTSGEKIRAKQIIKNFTMIKNEKKVHINQLKKFI